MGKKSKSKGASSKGKGSKSVLEKQVNADKFHNYDSPCCISAEAIANEIFPSLPLLYSKSSSSDEGAAETDDPKSSGANGSGDGSGTSNKKRPADRNKSSAEGEQNEQSVLAAVLQHHLIEERKLARNDAPPPSLAAGSKRKKKKKRKKKPGPNSSNSTDIDQNCENGVTKSECRQSPPSPTDCQGDISAMEQQRQPPPPQQQPESKNGNPSTASSGAYPASAAATPVDQVLDTLISSPPSSDNNKYANRSLDSFVRFLAKRYDAHVSETSRTQSSSEGSPAHESNKEYLPTVQIDSLRDIFKTIDCRNCCLSTRKKLRKYFDTNPTGCVGDPRWYDEDEDDGSNEVNAGSTWTLTEDSVKLGRDIPTQKSKKTSVNGLTVPISGMHDDDAFNYHALNDTDDEDDMWGDIEMGKPLSDTEEAKTDAVRKETSLSLEFHPILNSRGILQFLQLCPSRVGDMPGAYPLDAQTIANLTRLVLLPCGMHPLAVASASADASDCDDLGGLTLEEAEATRLQAQFECDSLITKIMGWKQSLESMKMKYNAACEKEHDRSYYGMEFTSDLKSVQTENDHLIRHIGSWLRRLTEGAVQVAWASNEVMDLLLGIWSDYFAMIESCYEKKLKRLICFGENVNNLGTIPLRMSDKFIRIMKVWTHQKLEATQLLTQAIQNRFMDSKNKNSYFPLVKQLFRLQVYRRRVDKSIVEDDDLKMFPDVSSQTIFEEFFAGITGVATKADIKCNISKLASHEESLRDQVAKYYRDVVKILNLSASSGFSSSKDSQLDQIFEALDDKRMEEEIKSRDCSNAGHPSTCRKRKELCKEVGKWQDKLASTVAECNQVIKRSSIAIKQWIVLLAIRQKRESALESLSLPGALMHDANLGETSSAWTASNDDEDEKCDGRDAERRFACVIATQVYRWLEKQSVEWHADLTREELIQSEMDLPATAGKSGAKKKKKKKKAKQTATTDAASASKSGESSEVKENRLGSKVDHIKPMTTTEIASASSSAEVVASTVSEADLAKDTEGNTQSTTCDTKTVLPQAPAASLISEPICHDNDEIPFELLQAILAADEQEEAREKDQQDAEWLETTYKKKGSKSKGKGQVEVFKVNGKMTSKTVGLPSSPSPSPSAEDGCKNATGTVCPPENTESVAKEPKQTDEATPSSETDKPRKSHVGEKDAMSSRSVPQKDGSSKQTSVSSRGVAAEEKAGRRNQGNIDSDRSWKDAELKVKQEAAVNGTRGEDTPSAIPPAIGETKSADTAAKKKGEVKSSGNGKSSGRGTSSNKSAPSSSWNPNDVPENAVPAVGWPVEPPSEKIKGSGDPHEVVGVVDDGRIVSAEQYLTRRLNIIVALEKSDTSSTWQGVPIVWL